MSDAHNRTRLPAINQRISKSVLFKLHYMHYNSAELKQV